MTEEERKLKNKKEKNGERKIKIEERMVRRVEERSCMGKKSKR